MTRRKITMAKPRIKTASGNTARTYVAPHGTKRVVLGRHLQARNARIRALYPLCCMCAAHGITRAFDEVDHRHALEDGGPDVESNCWGLCRACHVHKTNAEDERRRAGGDTSRALDWLPPRPAELDRGPTIA